MIALLYIIILLSWFFMGIPFNILGFYLGYKELKNKYTNNEKLAIKTAMAINIVFIVIMLISL